MGGLVSVPPTVPVTHRQRKETSVRSGNVLAGARRIRIAFCIDNAGVGGTELNALRTSCRLDRQLFDVRLVCLQQNGPLLARFREHDIPVLTLPLGRLYGPRAIQQGRRLARFLASERIDIVHSHDVYDNIFATLCARAVRTPVVIASRRWWHQVPRPVLRVVNRQAYRLADCVLANSPSVGKLLVEHEGVHADRLAIIPNFVDEHAFDAPNREERTRRRAKLGLPTEAFIVGCVASLQPVKDQECLILAVASLRRRWPALHLALIGDGVSRPALEALSRRMGVSDVVHFTGVQPNEPNLHHLFDVSALCSLNEAFPNSIVEAMAAARPIIATHVGGIPDAITDGETGRLVRPRSPESIAGVLEQLMRSPEGARRLGAGAQERARARYHGDRVIAQLEGLYERLLEARAR